MFQVRLLTYLYFSYHFDRAPEHLLLDGLSSLTIGQHCYVG